MLRYTLAIIRSRNEVLMINRNKAPWQGCWNGIGGKLEPGESPVTCVTREIWEETGLKVNEPLYRGIASWNPTGEPVQGMYLYLIDLQDCDRPASPVATREGILDWKAIDWIVAEENFGAVPTLRYLMPDILDPDTYPAAEFHFDFEGGVICSTEKRALPEDFLFSHSN